MSDKHDQQDEELTQALAEWKRSQLIALLYRLEQLEKQTDEPMFTRLPALNTEDERATATVEIMERVSDLEAKFRIDDDA